MSDRFIKNILEVPKTLGIVVSDNEERILVKDVPSFLSEMNFGDLGRRAQTMFDTLEDSYQAFDEVLLKFETNWVFLRKIGTLTLIILVEPGAKIASIRMVTNLAKRSITEEWIQKAQAEFDGVKEEPEPEIPENQTPQTVHPFRLEQKPEKVNLNQDSVIRFKEKYSQEVPPILLEDDEVESEKKPIQRVREAKRPKRVFRGKEY